MVEDKEVASQEVVETKEVSAFPTEVSPLDEAKEILRQNKEAVKIIQEERKRIEKAAAELLVTGRSFAGQVEKQETAEEKWKREAKLRYAGTGLDPT